MPDIDEQVTLLKTIADSTRLRILGLLAERPRTGTELVEELGLTAPTISHHLHRLRDVGIVSAEADAQRRVWSINTDLLGAVGAPSANYAHIDDEQARLAARFIKDGRLETIPSKRKAFTAVLMELLRNFEPGRSYQERQVNEILGRYHCDVATLRRGMIDYGYLHRTGFVYQVTNEVPDRTPTEAQEVPKGEADWLRSLIDSALPKV